jgi:hypothetical protein
LHQGQRPLNGAGPTRSYTQRIEAHRLKHGLARRLASERTRTLSRQVGLSGYPHLKKIHLDMRTQKDYKGPSGAQSSSQLSVAKIRRKDARMEASTVQTTEKCPWCGSVISHEKFVQIETRIRGQEQRKLEQAEASMRKQLEAQFSERLDAEKKAIAQNLREEANEALAEAAAERDRALGQLSEVKAQEAEARKQAQEVLEQLRVLQGSEAAARRQAQEAVDTAATLKKNFDQRLEVEKQAVEKRAKEETEAMLKKDMEHQRIILEQTYQADLAKQKSDFQKQNEAALKEVQDLKRKLEEQKTANQLGDGAEVDLYETLRREFQDDKVTRVQKGQPGPDIRHHVVYKGEVCGQIVYDSKNQQQWRDGWLSKLHQDQIDCGAEQAILATTVFPTGKKEICVDQSGVIVVHPARAVHIAHLLRKAMISMRVKGLGQKEWAEKTKKLYELINSNEYRQLFEHVQSLTEELLEVDVREKKAHDKVWKERGQLLIKQRNALRELDTKVAAIIEAPEAGERPAA